MATVTIRPATLDDLLAINRVHYAALDKFHDFYGAFLVPHPRDLLPRLNARGMSNPSQVFHVAVDGDEVVGFVRYQMVDAQGEAENDVKNVEPMAPQVKPKEHVKDLWEKFSERDGEMNGCYQKTSGGRRHAWVLHLMVHPSQQRKGIGRRLMGEVMSRADGEGVPTMIVSSMESYGLYSKLGFRGLGTFPIDSGYWMREVDRIEGELGMEGQGLGKQYEGVREDESWMVRWLKGGESGEAE